MREAILLTPSGTATVENPLTDDDRRAAAEARLVWGQALKDLVHHAGVLRDAAEQAKDGGGLSYLHSSLHAADADASLLSPIWELVTEHDVVGDESHEEFAFDTKNRRWLLGDQLLHRMSLAASGDVDKVHRLARAFFWHEYLHVPQRLTRYTAEGVGAFANCLERIDYMADAYSILHQADYILRNGSSHNGRDVTALLGRCEGLMASGVSTPPAGGRP